MNKLLFWLSGWDETGPLIRAYRRLLHRLMILSVVLLVLVVLSLVVGLPHLQSSYTYLGPRPTNGIVNSRQKINAWYLGPIGWQHVRSGQYGHDGCPYILFIPLWDCFD